MHPDDRPDGIELFRRVLLGKERRPSTAAERYAEPGLGEALKENRVAVALTLALFVLAVLLTVL
jgi:hypothetical protein